MLTILRNSTLPRRDNRERGAWTLEDLPADQPFAIPPAEPSLDLRPPNMRGVPKLGPVLATKKLLDFTLAQIGVLSQIFANPMQDNIGGSRYDKVRDKVIQAFSKTADGLVREPNSELAIKKFLLTSLVIFVPPAATEGSSQSSVYTAAEAVLKDEWSDAGRKLPLAVAPDPLRCCYEHLRYVLKYVDRRHIQHNQQILANLLAEIYNTILNGSASQDLVQALNTSILWRISKEDGTWRPIQNQCAHKKFLFRLAMPQIKGAAALCFGNLQRALDRDGCLKANVQIEVDMQYHPMEDTVFVDLKEAFQRFSRVSADGQI